MEKAHQSVLEILELAQREIIGHTKFQKMAYLLHVAGLLNEFRFTYFHYDPYSEKLTTAIQKAV